MKKLFFSAALAAGLMAAPAQAADTIACDVTLPSPNAVDCAGYFDGNLVGGSPSKMTHRSRLWPSSATHTMATGRVWSPLSC